MDTIGFACIAFGVIIFALVSKRLENTIVSPPMIFTLFGLVLGEAVFGVAKLDFGHGFIHGLAELIPAAANSDSQGIPFWGEM